MLVSHRRLSESLCREKLETAQLMTRAVYTKNILYMKCVYLFIEECPELQGNPGCLPVPLFIQEDACRFLCWTYVSITTLSCVSNNSTVKGTIHLKTNWTRTRKRDSHCHEKKMDVGWHHVAPVKSSLNGDSAWEHLAACSTEFSCQSLCFNQLYVFKQLIWKWGNAASAFCIYHVLKILPV